MIGHNKHKMHGLLKEWDRGEVERLLRKLVIEEFLAVITLMSLVGRRRIGKFP